MSPPKKKLPDGQQQQAISIYFFLEGLGFRVSRLFTEVVRFPGTGSPLVLVWSLRWTACLQRRLLFGRLMAARPFFPPRAVYEAAHHLDLLLLGFKA